MMTKKIAFYISLLFFFLVAIFSCRTTDIRTSEVKNNFNQEIGLKVLQKMYSAHSLHKWDSIDTYRVNISDEFYGIMGKFGNPFPNNIANFEFQAIPKTFTSRAIFRDINWENKVWGIQSWRTYATDKSGELKWHHPNDKTIEFWLPTYQYFIEAPIRIFEADIISYAGERSQDGRTYDLVYVTWKTTEPQKDIDQYILWVDRETNQLTQMQYTVRDQYRWIHATLRYTKYEEKLGLLFPSELEVNLWEPNNNDIFHKITFDNLRLNAVPRDSILVSPTLGSKGKN
ncbi:MAG: hypothetical protein MRY83_08830 [Flavobacteriales bacterium]|nr:hypothetical protein [Flavobacteriales bacterium]